MSISLAATTTHVPDVGQLVRVRGRNWVVTEIRDTALPLEVGAPPAGEGTTFVTLSSVEDDGLGEELSVLWELEPGRDVLERATLPDASEGRFDSPEELAAFLDALRWGAITSAETTLLQAPFRAGIAVEDYQLEPAIRALGMPRVNLMVADDVGLGKTIEAGLVIQELLLRHRARRVMVVCPAPLTEKWRDEMSRRFGLEFVVVNTERLSEVRRERGLHANPFRVFPFTVVSLAWLRGAKASRLLDEVLGDAEADRVRPIDLLIVDEAHHVAPPGRGRYAVDSQQTKAVRRLANRSEHRVFLSATPHNGYLESWTALLAMLDPQRFVRGVRPDPVALTEVLIRRLKTEILNEDGSRRYPNRSAEEIAVDYSPHELEAQTLVEEYAEVRGSERAAKPSRNGAHRAGVDLISLLLKKRLFSSPAALTATIQALRERLPDAEEEFADEPVVEVLSERRTEVLGLDFESDQAVDEAEWDALSVAAKAVGVEEQRLFDVLTRLNKWCDSHGQETDGKAAALIDFLRSTCMTEAGGWNDERVVVFTEYRDTQRWLLDVLERHGLGTPGRVALLFGGMDEAVRRRVTDQFQKPPHLHPVRIMLATDTASEGIDLQHHCHRLVNYDIPFNPNRLEQRAGRIDRYGQPETPRVFHFVGRGWEKAAPASVQGDLQFLSIIARKIATTREDLGSANPVISAAVERRMLGRSDPAFNVDRVLETAKTKPVLKIERGLREETTRLAAALRESRDALHCSPEDIERVVRTGLKLGRQPPLTTRHDERSGKPVYEAGPLTGTWARTISDLPDLDYGQRPLCFDADIAASRGDVVLAHLNHPLVAMATRLLRAEVWGSGDLSRVTSLVSDQSEDVLAAFSRLVLIGADGKRLHEEIFPAGGTVRSGTFARLGVRDLADRLDAALAPGARMVESPWEARAPLVENWPNLSASLSAAIDVRAAERHQSLERGLARKQREEEIRTARLLDAFADALREAIADDEADVQMSFAELDSDERQQMSSDRAAWRARLEGLPAERKAELASIARRYESVQLLVFPAAVVQLTAGAPS